MARLWGVGSRRRALHIAVIDAATSSVELSVPSENPLMVQPVQIRPRDLAPKGSRELLDSGNSAWLLFNRNALRAHGFGCATGLKLQDAGRRAQYRAAAIGVTATLCLATASYAAFTEIAARESAAHGSTAELIAEHVTATAEDSERMTPKADLEPEQLRAMVQTREKLLARNIDATGLMQSIALALQPFSDLEIDLLEWSYAAAPVAAPDGSSAPPPKIILVRLGGRMDPHVLKADANAAVGQLAAALGHQLNGQGRVEKLPFDVTPEGVLTGNPHDAMPTKPQFSVTVTVPVGVKRTT
jgi:hypothetical protein